jgi:hypothetical protein
MHTPVSRRTFFVALGGGLAASWMAFRVAASYPRINEPAIGEAFGKQDGLGYVDYEGWILTPADKRRLRTGERLEALPAPLSRS